MTKAIENKNTFSQKKSRRMLVDFSNPYPPFPREVFFDINNTCVCRCFFCGNRKITKRAYLDKKLAFKLLEDFYECGTREVAFYATGEPFLRDDLAEFVSKAKTIGYEYVFISSNGVIATPERAKPVLDAGLDSIKFSINAGTKESYLKVHGVDRFEDVVNNIKWFHAYRTTSGLKYKIYLSMVPTSVTGGEWPLLCEVISKYVDEMDCRGCSNQGGNVLENNLTETIDSKNLLGSLKQDRHSGKCPDIFFRCTITPQGYLSACVVDYQNFLIIGDLNNSHIKDLWHGQNYVNLRKKHFEGKLEGLICDNCLNNCQRKSEPLMPQFAMPFDNKGC